MSYSRWSNSRWYTFWCVHPRDQIETRASAIFEVCDVRQFNAAELRKDIDQCVEQACAISGGDVSKEEAAELKSYMLDFLQDVDGRYPSHGDRSE